MQKIGGSIFLYWNFFFFDLKKKEAKYHPRKVNRFIPHKMNSN